MEIRELLKELAGRSSERATVRWASPKVRTRLAYRRGSPQPARSTIRLGLQYLHISQIAGFAGLEVEIWGDVAKHQDVPFDGLEAIHVAPMAWRRYVVPGTRPSIWNRPSGSSGNSCLSGVVAAVQSTRVSAGRVDNFQRFSPAGQRGVGARCLGRAHSG